MSVLARCWDGIDCKSTLLCTVHWRTMDLGKEISKKGFDFCLCFSLLGVDVTGGRKEVKGAIWNQQFFVEAESILRHMSSNGQHHICCPLYKISRARGSFFSFFFFLRLFPRRREFRASSSFATANLGRRTRQTMEGASNTHSILLYILPQIPRHTLYARIHTVFDHKVILLMVNASCLQEYLQKANDMFEDGHVPY